MELGIKGHVAVVTGGGAGLGEQMACSLAGEGCKVAIWDLDHDAADVVAATIRGAGCECIALQVDVTDLESVRRATAEVLRTFGSVEILVNNAGFARHSPVVDMALKTWNDVLAANLTGPFLCTQAILPSMIAARYGRIINLSSRTHLGDYNNSAYIAAKAGVIGFTSAVALEAAPHGITVNAVAPGMIRTKRVMALPEYEDMNLRSKARTPIQRDGVPYDIAQAVMYLASAPAGFITGEVIHVTGGRYASA